MNKALKFLMLTIPFIIVHIILSNAIKTTPWIWYENRLFGLLSFVFLFITIMIGELRVIRLDKSDFKLFEYHVPVAIFATVLVLIHFIAAVFEKYKWGKTLVFSQYLGFTFTDQWMVFLSLGTLAFYFMILVGMTSMKKMVRFIGFKNWKLIHYFSYISFVFAFIHTINLGTDIKTSVLSVILKPLFIIMFWLVVAILIVRIMVSLNIFVDQKEITLMSIFIIILIVGGVFVTGLFYNQNNQEVNTGLNTQDLQNEINYYNILVQDLQQKNQAITNQIQTIEVT